MSENVTIARPYAKAVFSIANGNNALKEWDKLLLSLTTVVAQHYVKEFLKNKTVSYDVKADVLVESLDLQDEFDKDIRILYSNFVKILSYYGRLLYIKDVYSLYREYMNITLERVEAVIKVAHALCNDQKEHIINYLSARVNKKVSALFIIDERLLGGFWIRIGDFVYDASIIGNLISLRAKIIV